MKNIRKIFHSIANENHEANYEVETAKENLYREMNKTLTSEQIGKIEPFINELLFETEMQGNINGFKQAVGIWKEC